MNRNIKIKVILNADKSEYESQQNFEKVSGLLEPTIWINDENTFEYEIHFEPTYNLLLTQFSFDSTYVENRPNRISYKSYLTDDEIKSLSIFDYAGEKIYRLALQDNSDREWDVTKPEQLHLVTTKLHDYLSQNQLIEYQDETLQELKDLIEISNFCNQCGIEVLFFDPDC